MVGSRLYQREGVAFHLPDKDCKLGMWGAVSHGKCVASGDICGKVCSIQCPYAA